MWSDNDIDNAFQRLNPPEPEPAPFPLDAWLRLETQLDKEEVARTVRRKMWRFFAAEVLIVALVSLGWLLWKPSALVAPTASPIADVGAARLENPRLSVAAATQSVAAAQPRRAASAPAASAAEPTAAANRAYTAEAPATPAAPEVTSTAGRGVAPASHISPLERRKSALGLVATAPRLNLTPEFRKAEGRTSRLSVAALASSRSRKAGRPAEKRALNSYRGNALAAAAQPKSRAALAAASEPASALVVADRGRREIRQQQAEGLRAAETGAITTAALTSAAEPTADNDLAADNAALLPRPVSTATVGLALPASLVQVSEIKSVASAPEPRFFIGLMGAPDVSTVKFVSVEKPLLNLGLTVEYRFTNRLRLSTGLLRANKDYYARREDYDWTNYPRAQTRDFTWVEGKCTVLDVPLNLRYDAVVRDNARLFGAAGLSSFFMQRENYSYDYLEGGDYKLWEMPGLVNANQHLFSVLNLSAGYERSLSRHWRLQAEPYVKVPLGGVGAGKVKLTSAGVFLGVKYGF